MKKISFAILVIILLLLKISAIRINEIESNPAGADSGNEWVELYNSGNFDLGGYRLVNNDGDEIELSGSISGSDYYVYTFDKQWLDNSDEKVFLYDENNKLVDETDLVDDGDNNGKTWQFCDGDWRFAEGTKEKKNDCSISSPDGDEKDVKSEDTNEKSETISLVRPGTDGESGNIETKTAEYKGPEVIVLNQPDSKDIKTEDNKKTLDKSDYAFYGFIGFCILLVALFVIRKKVQDKNEFE